LSVAGTLEQPRLDFRSEPAGWDEADIASYLNLSVTPEQLSALEQRDAVTRLLSQRLLSYFQTQAAKRARGFANLDYLEIESGLLNGRGAKVTVGKYVGRKLYVSYTQGFTSDVQTQFRVEYYINRRNELVAERNDQGRYALRYRFKLRY
jgi:autotransporter translocation and assembly factor TamB